MQVSGWCACSSQDGGRGPEAGRETQKGTQAHRQRPQAHMGEAGPRTTGRDKKRNTMGDKQKQRRKSKGWSDQRESEKKPQKTEKGREKRTEGHQQGQARGQVGERQREEVREQYSPKRQEEVPGGRAFLTSTFCFRKAANCAGMNQKELQNHSQPGKGENEKE